MSDENTDSIVDEASAADYEKRARKIQMLRNTNSGLANEIQSMGAAVDLGVARIEAFIMYLVDLGMLTTDQQLTEQEDWERSLRNQLIPLRDQIKEQVERARAAHEKDQAGPGPKAGNGPGLILPSSARRK